MEGGDEIRELLREIRDAQREHLAEYRRVAERSLELQQRAVARQEQMARVYRGLVLVGGILVAALLALLESGMFEALPGLRVVVTSLALGGALLAGGIGDGARLRQDTPAALRRHVYIDTTGMHPVTVRSTLDLVGADHVLLGTDWPVVIETAEKMQAVLAACGLDPAEQQMVASGNTLRLLGPAVLQ